MTILVVIVGNSTFFNLSLSSSWRKMGRVTTSRREDLRINSNCPPFLGHIGALLSQKPQVWRSLLSLSPPLWCRHIRWRLIFVMHDLNRIGDERYGTTSSEALTVQTLLGGISSPNSIELSWASPGQVEFPESGITLAQMALCSFSWPSLSLKLGFNQKAGPVN